MASIDENCHKRQGGEDFRHGRSREVKLSGSWSLNLSAECHPNRHKNAAETLLLGFESLLPKQVDKKYESRIRIHAKWQAPRGRCPLSSWKALKDTTRAAKSCASAGSIRPGSKDRHLHISPARSYNFYQWAMEPTTHFQGSYNIFNRQNKFFTATVGIPGILQFRVRTSHILKSLNSRLRPVSQL
jgi:hypothetical protein